MDTAAEIERNPVRPKFSLSIDMSRLTRDGTAKPILRDQILRRGHGQAKFNFSCIADHEQGWQL